MGGYVDPLTREDRDFVRLVARGNLAPTVDDLIERGERTARTGTKGRVYAVALWEKGLQQLLDHGLATRTTASLLLRRIHPEMTLREVMELAEDLVAMQAD